MRAHAFHQLFEAQVEKSPQAVAVTGPGGALTYHELNARANQLAHLLIRLGIGPEVLVGLFMRRSPEMLVALLGILKAGGAYVPLDPTFPKKRLSFLLEDTRPPVVLIQPVLRSLLPEHECQVVSLDSTWQAIAAEKSNNPGIPTSPDLLAYVIFTSGSTGNPKGILATHDGLANYLTWCVEAYGMQSGKGALVHTPVSFDLTITGMFAPLLVGRTVYQAAKGHAIDALTSAWRTNSGLSIVKITPAQLKLLGQILTPEEAAGRTRAFIIGGENLTSQHIEFWQRCAPDTVLVNEYGPSETVVGCCVYFVPGTGHQVGSIPIGRPIANTQLHVLDQDLRQVPHGQPGELFIGGAGLARGYHRRPDLTAERFIPDPYGDEPGGRLYRTGDLVRMLPDGNLVFLGRVDQQVKISGIRIELEEIEAVLGQHSSVQSVVVTARDNGMGEKRLVAYVVPRPGMALTLHGMREFLQDLLPRYMVPTALVLIDRLPLTANGKVDRAALPAPSPAVREATPAFAEPRNPLEARMVKLWEAILNVQPIGIRDNFFELGGDSLSSVSLLAEIHRTLGREISVSSLMESPTVEQLITALERPEGPRLSAAGVVKLQSRGDRPPFFLLPGIGGNVVSLRLLANYLAPDQPVYSLKEHSSSQGPTPSRTLPEMAARFVEEMRAHQPTGPYFLGGYSFGGTVAFEMARQLERQGQVVGRLIIIDQRAHPMRSRDGVRLGHILEFARNLPAWIYYDLLQTDPRVMFRRIRLRLGALVRRLTSRFRRQRTETPPAVAAAAAVMDLDRLPAEAQARMERHFALLLDYVPQRYRGRVILLRARAQPLSRLQGRDLGWNELAAGGTEIIGVPGSHESILRDPYVKTLARHVHSCLARARSALSDQFAAARAPALSDSGPQLFSATTGDDSDQSWSVVVNQEGQYSLWPAGRTCPAGWQRVGPIGPRSTCLEHIRKEWVDLRPRSLRESDRRP